MENKRIVVMDNDLLRASYKLELTEQRLIASLISRIESKITEVWEEGRLAVPKRDGETLDSKKIYSISVPEFAREWGITTDNARKELLTAVKVLFKREFTLKITETKVRTSHWVQMVEYDSETDTVGLRWTEDIIPYISQLERKFTKTLLVNYIPLKNTYSWRLKDIITSRSGEVKGSSVKFTPAELIDVLKVPESRTTFGQLNSKIIVPAVRELVNKGVMPNLRVSYIKQHRVVTYIVFDNKAEEDTPEGEVKRAKVKQNKRGEAR